MQTPPVHLIRVDLSQNMARFYDISLQATLFGEVVLLRRWGRIGARAVGMVAGQVRVQTFAGGAAALAAQDRLVEAKQRRGYHRLP
jgi:predicted DNA-binding WGR domain protein